MESNLHHSLVDSVLRGDSEAVMHLVRLGVDINYTDEQGLTALHWCAASEDGEKLVPFLLSIGSKPDKRDNFGHTPLHLHCKLGRKFGVSCLLHQGCDANARMKESLKTPLHLASDNNHTDVAKLLLAYGAKASTKDANGIRPKELFRESDSISSKSTKS